MNMSQEFRKRQQMMTDYILKTENVEHSTAKQAHCQQA